MRFLIATNPGQEPGPLARVASGGELSRLMLAMKVVLSAGSAVPTLVFDEVDSGIGGATAAAVGERSGAGRRGGSGAGGDAQPAGGRARRRRICGWRRQPPADRTSTTVDHLAPAARREEIARMLAGETIIRRGRAAAADDLLRGPAAAAGAAGMTSGQDTGRRAPGTMPRSLHARSTPSPRRKPPTELARLARRDRASRRRLPHP